MLNCILCIHSVGCICGVPMCVGCICGIQCGMCMWWEMCYVYGICNIHVYAIRNMKGLRVKGLGCRIHMECETYMCMEYEIWNVHVICNTHFSSISFQMNALCEWTTALTFGELRTTHARIHFVWQSTCTFHIVFHFILYSTSYCIPLHIVLHMHVYISYHRVRKHFIQHITQRWGMWCKMRHVM